jgi:hypothetical protein
MAWEVGRRKAEAMLILLKVWLSNEKIRQSAAFPALYAQESAQPIETKSAVVNAFIHFRLELGETEIFPDLPRHW